MNKREIRPLKANEVECRVQSISEKGAILLLYKDARADMKILDEVFGATNWQRSHQVIGDRLYCTVSIWDEEKQQWISKQDLGTESNTEKEKGQASDSFKRACFNLGIGRELYSSPFIFVQAKDMNIIKKGAGFASYDRFSVAEIDYNEDREIVYLKIKNEKTNKIVYQYGRPSLKIITNGTTQQILVLAKQYAELAQKTPEDIFEVLKGRYQFDTLNDLSDNAGQDICAQLSDWIVRTKQKNAAG